MAVKNRLVIYVKNYPIIAEKNDQYFIHFMVAKNNQRRRFTLTFDPDLSLACMLGPKLIT
jgi:hypothetical protein